MRNDALSTAMVATMSAARTANNKKTVPDVEMAIWEESVEREEQTSRKA
jgi:hypothetical protein